MAPLIVRVSVFGAIPIDVHVLASSTVQKLLTTAVDQENRNGAEILPKASDLALVYFPRKSELLEAGSTLAGAGVKNNDFLKVILRGDAGQIRIFVGGTWDTLPTSQAAHHAGKILKVDFTEPLFRLIPRICQLFKIRIAKNTEEYMLRLAVDPEDDAEQMIFAGNLNVNLSLREQDVRPKCCILVTTVSSFAKRPLSNYKSPVMEGWMSKSSRKADRKATGKKKRWCVFQDGMLAYFAKKKPTEVPKGVVGVEYMQVSIHESTLILEKSTASWTKRPLVFELTPEGNRKELLLWERALTVVAANGAPFRTFGLSLQAVMEREKDQSVPFVVEKTLAALNRESCLESEGLLRQTGNLNQIEHWKDMCDRGQQEEACADFEGADPDSVAGLLKLFLRELPEPILTFDLYSDFVSAGKARDIAAMGKLLQRLPKPNQGVLKALLGFLAAVIQAKNRMGDEDVARVLSPNLLRPRVENESTVHLDSAYVTDTIVALIENRKQFRFRKAVPVRKTSKVAGAASHRTRGITVSAAMLGPPPESLAAPPPLASGKVEKASKKEDSGASDKKEASDDEGEGDSGADDQKGASDEEEEGEVPELPADMMLPPPVLDLPEDLPSDDTPLPVDLPPPEIDE